MADVLVQPAPRVEVWRYDGAKPISRHQLGNDLHRRDHGHVLVLGIRSGHFETHVLIEFNQLPGTVVLSTQLNLQHPIQTSDGCDKTQRRLCQGTLAVWQKRVPLLIFTNVVHITPALVPFQLKSSKPMYMSTGFPRIQTSTATHQFVCLTMAGSFRPHVDAAYRTLATVSPSFCGMDASIQLYLYNLDDAVPDLEAPLQAAR
mmetsp:Transcript_124123/g.227817  ORF Transcript_124123/g.227817 Transcript_124123/m.227817 type:complete len:203 (-) Transcript_124123:407-1015(-)